MFHSEMGAPSASPAAMIRKYSGDLSVTPGTHANSLWNRQPWWLDWPKFAQEQGREPKSLEEFVAWSQKRQSDALALAVSSVKSRFPACGGVILWMGHDCFPCTSNASVLDFDGNPKPVAHALERVICGSKQV
jgi:beta-mannosidase